MSDEQRAQHAALVCLARECCHLDPQPMAVALDQLGCRLVYLLLYAMVTTKIKSDEPISVLDFLDRQYNRLRRVVQTITQIPLRAVQFSE